MYSENSIKGRAAGKKRIQIRRVPGTSRLETTTLVLWRYLRSSRQREIGINGSSALVVLTSPQRPNRRLKALLQLQRRLNLTPAKAAICTIVWSEFRCGPIGPSELVLARQIFPSCVPFLTEGAERSADLFNRTGRGSRSLADCQIASIALRRNAGLATVNKNDFKIFQRYGLQLM